MSEILIDTSTHQSDHTDVNEKLVIPWRRIYMLSHLTFLIYDCFRNWKLTKLKDLDKLVKKEKYNKNSELGMRDIQMLTELKKNYPEGEVVKYLHNSANMQVVICKSPTQKSFTIVFRGSENMTDWLHNFMTWKKKIPIVPECECTPEAEAKNKSKLKHMKGVKVHNGFYNQLFGEGVYSEIVKYIGSVKKDKDYDIRNWPWYLTGHSAGGAQATLCGFLLGQYFRRSKFTVVTLASPRVGDKEFKKEFESLSNVTHYRVANGRDCVTAVPTIGYYHTGISLLYKKKQWLVNPKTRFYIYNFWNPFDHSVGAYNKNLEKRVKEEVLS